MNPDTETPRPCPFCGSEKVALVQSAKGDSYMFCLGCQAKGAPAKEHDKARENWNRREGK